VSHSCLEARDAECARDVICGEYIFSDFFDIALGSEEAEYSPY
jgi:hypothetical protein